MKKKFKKKLEFFLVHAFIKKNKYLYITTITMKIEKDKKDAANWEIFSLSLPFIRFLYLCVYLYVQNALLLDELNLKFFS